jgi:hypothetical protein
MPDGDAHRWLPWLREQRAEGLQVYLSSQCTNGTLQPELYRSGSVAIELVRAQQQMRYVFDAPYKFADLHSGHVLSDSCHLLSDSCHYNLCHLQLIR